MGSRVQQPSVMSMTACFPESRSVPPSAYGLLGWRRHFAPGRCFSAAVIPLLAGDSRGLRPLGHLMLHGASLEVGWGTAQSLRAGRMFLTSSTALFATWSWVAPTTGTGNFNPKWPARRCSMPRPPGSGACDGRRRGLTQCRARQINIGTAALFACDLTEIFSWPVVIFARAVGRALDDGGEAVQPQPEPNPWVQWSGVINDRLAALDARSASIDETFGAIDSIFGDHERRIGELGARDENDIGVLKKQLSEAEARILHLEDAIAQLPQPKAALIEHYRDENGRIVQSNVFTGLAMATAAIDDNTSAAATAPRPPAAKRITRASWLHTVCSPGPNASDSSPAR